MPTTPIIPTGYTFIHKHGRKQLVSEKALKRTRELLEKSQNRNPDFHGMYIYNDFYSYAVLDLIDKELSGIHTKITKKEWSETWILLEALTLFFDMESCWPMCDDGDRVARTHLAYATALATTLRNLPDRDTQNYPSIRNVLRVAAKWGENMNGLGCTSQIRGRFQMCTMHSTRMQSGGGCMLLAQTTVQLPLSPAYVVCPLHVSILTVQRDIPDSSNFEGPPRNQPRKTLILTGNEPRPNKEIALRKMVTMLSGIPGHGRNARNV